MKPLLRAIALCVTTGCAPTHDDRDDGPHTDADGTLPTDTSNDGNDPEDAADTVDTSSVEQTSGFSDPEDVAQLLIGLQLFRQADQFWWGALDGDDGCPSVVRAVHDDDDDDEHGHGHHQHLASASMVEFVGDCTTEDGTRFEGSLRRTRTRGDDFTETTWVGHGWSMSGSPDATVQRATLDGLAVFDADISEHPNYPYGVNRHQIHGTFGVEVLVGTGPALSLFGTGDMTYLQEGVSMGRKPHLRTYDLVLEDGRHLVGSWDYDVVVGACGATDGLDGTFEFADGTSSTVLLPTPSDCDQCYAWTIDGEPQAEPLCVGLGAL